MWADLSQKLNNKVSPKNIYTIVKTNRHNIWQILELGKIDKEIPDQGPNTNSSQESSDDFHSPESKADKNPEGQCYDITFEISISHQRWQEIWPEKASYNEKSLNTCKREYTILKRGAWTHVVYEEIWKNIKTSCTLRFRRAKMFPYV